MQTGPTVCTGIESPAPKVNSSATGVTHNSWSRLSPRGEMSLEFSVSGILLIESVPLTLKSDGIAKTVMVNLKNLELLSSDDNYIIYKSEQDTEYCNANTIIFIDLNTKTIKTTNIPIDPYASAIKIYKDNTTCDELIFVATLDNDINVYSFASGKLIKKLYAQMTDYSYLIDKIHIFKPDAENMIILTNNYKYNSIWNYNTAKYIPYPKELQNTIYYVYIDEVDKKVYLYSSYRLIIFTDLIFQNYKVLCESKEPVFLNMHPFRIGKCVLFGFQIIDAESGTNITPADSVINTVTYEKTLGMYGNTHLRPITNMPDYYKSNPCFTNQYIIFNTEFNIIVTDYNFTKLDTITICDKSDDNEIQKTYIRGKKVFCTLEDGSIKTCVIYCTKQDVADMNQYLTDCQLFPPEIITNIMSYC